MLRGLGPAPPRVPPRGSSSPGPCPWGSGCSGLMETSDCGLRGWEVTGCALPPGLDLRLGPFLLPWQPVWGGDRRVFRRFFLKVWLLGCRLSGDSNPHGPPGLLSVHLPDPGPTDPSLLFCRLASVYPLLSAQMPVGLQDGLGPGPHAWPCTRRRQAGVPAVLCGGGRWREQGRTPASSPLCLLAVGPAPSGPCPFGVRGWPCSVLTRSL